MIKVKLLDNRFRVFKKMKELEEKLEDLPKQYLKNLATEVVFHSPVDTGTYMDAHNIGEVGAYVTSTNKPRGQPYEPYAEDAITRMFAQIDNLPVDTTRYYISNSAAHAEKVELDHMPYTIAKSQSDILLEQARREVGL